MELYRRDLPGGVVVVLSAFLTVFVALTVDWDRMLTGEDIDLSTLLPCDERVGSHWKDAEGTTSWDVQIPVTCSDTAPFGLRLEH